MKKIYPVLFTKLNDAKDTILIEVPDLKALTEGYGIENAIEMARDIIMLTATIKAADGEELPEATELDKIDITEGRFFAYGKTFASLVDVDLDAHKK